jgi:hypothetical protein
LILVSDEEIGLPVVASIRTAEMTSAAAVTAPMIETPSALAANAAAYGVAIETAISTAAGSM